MTAMQTRLRSIYRLQALLALLLLAAQQGDSQLYSPTRSNSTRAAAVPTLSNSTNCPGSILTVNSSIAIQKIEWQKNNAPLQTVNATWTGITVAGNNGSGSGLKQFDSALAMIMDGTGNIYVSDYNNHRVLKFPPGSDQLTDGVIVAGGNGQGDLLNQLNKPAGLFLDATGNLFVADMNNHRVLKFSPPLSQASVGVVVAGGNGLGQALTQLNSPVGLYIDNAQRLYVADRDNHRVLRYPNGSTSLTAGVQVAGGIGDGPALTQLDQPVSILMDAAGDLLISEYANHRVTKWTPGASPLTGTVVAGNNGPGNALNQLRSPAGIIFDADGQLLIADANNDRIVRWKIGDAAGVEVINNGEGAGPDQLNLPLAIQQDAEGHFFVLDVLNNRVQKFFPTIVKTLTAAGEGDYSAVVTTVDGLLASTGVVMIDPNLTPAVTVAPADAAVCQGKITTFTAAPDHGGNTPIYQWKLNGLNAGAGTNTFIPAVLANGDIVSCIMTASADAGCLAQPSATSNNVVMIVNLPPVMQPITGTTTLCSQTTSQLSNTTLNNSAAWKSLSPAIATVNNSGLVTGVSAGTAVIRYIATSANGCVDSVETTVTIDPLVTPILSIAPVNTVICAGTPFQLTASSRFAGTAPTYQWMLNGTPTAITGANFSSSTLQDGDAVTCVLTPSADAGCLASPTVTSLPFVMTVYPRPVMQPITGNQGICPGTTLQLATATVSSTAIWKSLQPAIADVSASGLVTGLTTGSTIIRYIAGTANGCEDSTEITITVSNVVHPSITVSPSATAICPGSEVSFTANSAMAGITPNYQWLLNGLPAGTTGTVYKTTTLNPGDEVSCILTPSADAGCVVSSRITSPPIAVTVHPLPAMVATTGNLSICPGATTQLTNATANATGQWKSLQPAIATIAPGGLVTGVSTGAATIRYIATSAAGCQDSIDIVLTVNAQVQPTITVTPSASAICPGGTVSFTASSTLAGNTPAYQWLLNNAGTGITGTAFSPATLKPGDAVSAILTPSADAGCITSATVTSAPVSVTFNPSPTMALTTGNLGICPGATTQLTNATANATGQWKSLQPAIATISSSGLATGVATGAATIRYIATSAAGCQDSIDITLTISAQVHPTITVNPSATAICPGSPISFTAVSTLAGNTPAYQWLLNNTATGISGASYTPSTLKPGDAVSAVLTPSADAGCIATTTVTSAPVSVTIHPTPTMAPITGNLAICPGATTQLSNATANATGQWKSLQPAIASISTAGLVTGLGTGTATIRYIATSGAGCQDSIDINVTVNASITPTVTVNPSATMICKGAVVNFTVNSQGAGTNPAYSWLLNGKATGVTANTYSSISLQHGDAISCVITPGADAGCVTSTSVTSAPVAITVNNPPVMLSTTGMLSVCKGSTTQLANATPNVKGTWKSLQPAIATVNSSGLVTGQSAGTAVIRYTGTTPGGCADSTDVQLTVRPAVTPAITIRSDHNDTCTGTLIAFEAMGTEGGSQPTYQWQVNSQPTGSGTTFSTSQLHQGDVVTCVLASNAACAVPATATSNIITMTIYSLPEVNAGSDKTILKGETVLLEGRLSSDVTAIQWLPPTGLQNTNSATPVASPATTTTYQLEATTGHGCKATDAVTVSVITGIRIPNAFSPNGDGIHDTWELTDLQSFTSADIQVFNRNGQAVYHAKGFQPGRGWNGSYNGYVLPAGTYYYVIDLKNGKPKLSGSVTLLK
ncbi:Ig-like domain-containing protein [Paraflavitalea sp. CAU 1676]|uniref:Ig-like domain-containing protein n=1 Tax=Paraflavitalea sp. CAU 1676 TaxID=3032598 RepID=UPI0023DC69C3|nr:Ig-like domain-containing protein [Paraflavitalea sp. CAU 1676]MDF2191444.1 Ig-like domain-containing protein [Paraflavitalea sp. CAU 1676]